MFLSSIEIMRILDTTEDSESDEGDEEDELQDALEIVNTLLLVWWKLYK